MVPFYKQGSDEHIRHPRQVIGFGHHLMVITDAVEYNSLAVQQEESDQGINDRREMQWRQKIKQPYIKKMIIGLPQWRHGMQ